MSAGPKIAGTTDGEYAGGMPNVQGLVVVPLERLREVLAAVVAEHVPASGDQPVAPVLVNGTELGRRLGCSRSTVFRLEGDGMPSVRLGDVRRYDPRDCLAWLKAREAQRRAREAIDGSA
ncbi:MAG TPA: hypothetical protein VK843_16980 [Planctomycetota bacterium]|nr:hypothetical protein [Planctomycetota bacterium]